MKNLSAVSIFLYLVSCAPSIDDLAIDGSPTDRLSALEDSQSLQLDATPQDAGADAMAGDTAVNDGWRFDAAGRDVNTTSRPSRPLP